MSSHVKGKNKMNPSLLIVGSLALNFHHYNIQSNQKKYKPIRTINDLDLIVSSDFLDFYLANLKTSHPDWIVTLQDTIQSKKVIYLNFHTTICLFMLNLILLIKVVIAMI